MPKSSHSSQCSRSSQHSLSSQSMPLDIHHSSIDQLTRLPVEVLRLHLSSRHLVTSGNKSIMTQRLYHALHNIENSSFVVATSPIPMPTSSTSTAMVPSLLVMIPPPASLTQPIMSTSAALPTILPSAITSEASFQPELQSQLSTLMRQLIQQATAAVASMHNSKSIICLYLRCTSSKSNPVKCSYCTQLTSNQSAITFCQFLLWTHPLL